MTISNYSDRVYAPYSGITETCLIAGKSGMIYPGVRIENIAFPLSISAMQGAICSCLGNGDQPAAVVISGKKPELYDQWIKEFNLDEPDSFPDDAPVYDPFIAEIEDIAESLKELAGKAVTTHSDFPVSALLETDRGTVPGVNVEVEAWALGLCAERVAIFRAVSAGVTEFNKIHVYAPKGDYSSPCGACRQVLAEWMPRERIALYHGDGTRSGHFISELLPFGFTSKGLG